ncbi:hypothetical protein GND98_014290 [Clostridium butyricum]|jgi:hypothetical protein|uniref:Cell wall-binding protein n=1 Tax=Clostridium butyricum TaxID=1492 RepID=A0A6L9EQU5_CLOBU|nr:hypothetical protein [Clostridium butyricum]
MKRKILLLTCIIFLTTIKGVNAESTRYIYPSYTPGNCYADSSHWQKIGGHWTCANEDFHQPYCNAWVNTNSKWYYVDKNGYMVTDAWVGDCYVDSSGVRKTGWVQQGENWFYFYTNGTKAINTTIDGFTLGVDGKWDKNPEFTPQMAINFAKLKYSDSSTEATCGGSFDYSNGKKYYYVHLAKKDIQKLGGTGTIGNCKVYADGTVQMI